MELVSLKLFDKDPLVKEINELKEYISLIQEELEFREEKSSQKFSVSQEGNEEFEGVMKSIANKKAILHLKSEISSKQSFLQELKASLLRNKEVIQAEHEEFVNKRSHLFEELNKLFNSGYKTEVHKAWFTYLRTNLSIYEKMLVNYNEDKHKITTDTGIKEGIVYFYTQLLYAIDEHQKYRQ